MLTWHFGFSYSPMVVTFLVCVFFFKYFYDNCSTDLFLFGKITTWIQALYRLLVRSHAFIVKLDTWERKFYFNCLFALIPHLWNYRLLEFMSTTIFDKVNATLIFSFCFFFTFFLSFLPTNDFSFLFAPNNSSHLNGVIAFLEEIDEKESAKQNEKICISAFFPDVSVHGVPLVFVEISFHANNPPLSMILRFAILWFLNNAIANFSFKHNLNK